MDASATPLSRVVVVSMFLLAGVSAVWIVVWSTPVGLAVTPDSAIYIEAARNILAGDGFQYAGEATDQVSTFVPSTHRHRESIQ